VVGVVGELLVLIAASLVGSLLGWGLLVPTWIGGHFVLGFVLGRGGEGRRRLFAALASVPLAGVVASLGLTVLVFLGVSQDGLRANGPVAVFGTMLVGTAVITLILGTPIVALGVIVGRIPGRLRVRGRAKAVARGEAPLIQPIEPLERKSTAKAALDDAELAKVTAGGAATRIIRTYPWKGGDAMLAADTARLAAIGYLATKVDRKEPARGFRAVAAVLVGLVLLVIALAGDWLLAGFDFGWGTGGITATFDLVASDHHPVPVNTSA
jgi:hypothetical protein